jgi:hypothetical protein
LRGKNMLLEQAKSLYQDCINQFKAQITDPEHHNPKLKKHKAKDHPGRRVDDDGSAFSC